MTGVLLGGQSGQRGRGGGRHADRRPGGAEGPVDRRVIKGALLRIGGSQITITDEPPTPEELQEPARRPARGQRLALAHHLQVAIDKGIVADRALRDVAHAGTWVQ